MWISKTEFKNKKAEKIVEKLRNKLSKEFGVTIQGSIVTLRYSEKNSPLIEISMVITNIDDGIEEEFEFEYK
jgi:hypothetical protein